MPQIPADKTYFTFSKGLNTEASPINFPDEATIDEENFELQIDGSRKRRRGLDLESGGSAYTLPTALSASDVINARRWRNAGGDPDKNFIVVQSGMSLIFFEDTGTTISTGVVTDVVDLSAVRAPSATDNQIKQNPVDITFGRGHLFLSGRYVRPCFVSFDDTDDSFTVTPIQIRERDFDGVEDGYDWSYHPPSGLTGDALTAHKYNLYNRGWRDADITQYASDQSEFPAKNQVWYRGYRRLTVTNYWDHDGDIEWDSDKMSKELHSNASAPQGSLIRDPFDTQYATTSTSAFKGITAVTNATGLPAASLTLTITAAAHGYSNGETAIISGHVMDISLFDFSGDPTNPTSYSGNYPLDGSYTIANVTTDTFEITFTAWGTIYAVTDLAVQYGVVGEGGILRPAGEAYGSYSIDQRPEVVQWFAGRVFYTGIANAQLNDHVFFSRIVHVDEDYGRCFQDSDPTDETLNALQPDDGGAIVISDLGSVKRAEVFGASLMLFTDNGVWEISGGQRGFFTADQYSVRKLSEVEASSKYGVVKVEDNIYWTGPKGIYRMYFDPQTRQIAVVSVTENTVQTLWNSIGETKQSKVKAEYDDARKRVYFLYQSDSDDKDDYTKALVLDIRLGAFYKLKFPSGIGAFIAIRDADSSDTNKKIKFFASQSSGTTLEICDMDQSDYLDFDDTESVPYITTGYDNLADFQRFRQAPIIHVYAQKTETGYTASGTDLIPVNESSILMQARWDWADNTNSGKYSTAQQVYRHKRYYQPASASDTFDDGQPVVVTRNKVRGRGRSLHLNFTGEATKDAHILGWAIHYMGDRRL